MWPWRVEQTYILTGYLEDWGIQWTIRNSKKWGPLVGGLSFNPFEKICSSERIHLPQFSGWQQKIFEVSPPRYTYKLYKSKIINLDFPKPSPQKICEVSPPSRRVLKPPLETFTLQHLQALLALQIQASDVNVTGKGKRYCRTRFCAQERHLNGK